MSRHVVTIGACATSGGVQALRNFADVGEYASIVYANPDYISTLDQIDPIAAHIPVDFELQGCPIDQRQLLEVLSAFLAGAGPRSRAQRLRRVQDAGNVCVMVAHGTPCLGPITHAGCGAVPQLRPRLLRLLRPDGDARCTVAHAAFPGHGRARGRHRPGAAHVQHLA